MKPEASIPPTDLIQLLYMEGTFTRLITSHDRRGEGRGWQALELEENIGRRWGSRAVGKDKL
jgi:hypothetical protein